MYLRPDFAARLSESERTFSFLFHLRGKIYREALGRKTLKFSLHGTQYFLKVHTGVGWKEIVKNLFQFRLPVISAVQEWNALHRLREIGIDTVTPLGYGCEGINPAHRRSFIITEDLGETVSLEELGARWQQRTLRAPIEVALKRSLIRKIGVIVRRMHANGINHRDLYLCHLHIARTALTDPDGSDWRRIYVMDLHRAQIRPHPPPRRWIVKDLAGLHFSSMDIQLTQRDRYRFIQAYEGCSLKQALAHDVLWRQVRSRAIRLYDKHHRRSSTTQQS